MQQCQKLQKTVIFTILTGNYLLPLPVGSFITSSFRFLWLCIVSKVWRERKNQQDVAIRCLLSTSVSTCFGHHYAHLQENKDCVNAYGVLRWFCRMWLVAVVGRSIVGCKHCSHPTTQRPTWCPKHVETEVDNISLSSHLSDQFNPISCQLTHETYKQ